MVKTYQDFITPKNNPLDQFYFSIYFYRNSSIDLIHEDYKDFVNVLLQKITVVNVFAFSVFFEKNLQKEISEDLTSIQNELSNALKDKIALSSLSKLSSFKRFAN